MAMSSVAPANAEQHVSGAWYLVPFFFGILGGIIAWAVNKDKDPKRARNLLIFGLLWTFVPLIIVIAVFFYTVPMLAPTR
jgi:heme/copper-type cytochrome/quinol oxidase subunit 2